MHSAGVLQRNNKRHEKNFVVSSESVRKRRIAQSLDVRLLYLEYKRYSCMLRAYLTLVYSDRLHSAIDRNREKLDKELRSNWD